MFDIFYTGAKPNLFPHEQSASSLNDARAKSKTKFFWLVNGQYDMRKFNFTWFPPKWEEHQTHIFLKYSQFEQFDITFAPAHIDKEVEHYYDKTYLARCSDPTYWNVLYENVDAASLADWAPNPFEPPYIYVFGNQWYPAQEMTTVEYRIPGATERKYVDEITVTLLPNKTNWLIPEEVNEAQLDFSWVPHPKDPPYIYHFGTEFQESVGLTYTVPNAVELKFVEELPTIDKTNAVQVLSLFFVDMNNKSANARYESLKLKYPEIQRIRFMNGWIETIRRCVTRSKTTKFWVISSENVYYEFDFTWHAQPWQASMTHVFGSQWQKWSDTFLINRYEFERHAKWATSLEQFPNLNFVNDQPVYRPDDLYDIYYVDHFNPGSKENIERIQKRYPDVKVARYVDNYLDTFKRIISTAETEYVWIINSICDYSKFDFTWQPEPWQATMLHVFPSDNQKFGDTFYVHVLSFKDQMGKLELLDWFDTVNYCSEQIVPRLPIDIIEYDNDSLTEVVKGHSFTGPFAIFKHTGVTAALPKFDPAFWRKRDRVVHSFTASGSVAIVPRDAKIYLDTQMYDFPHILPHKDEFLAEKESDIIFISYDEPQADENFAKLVSKFPRAKRLHGVEGMEKALLKAAEMSTTPWYYAVFAKTELAPGFMFDYSPDYMQEPKHYIFYAHNPMNGLEYGHMGVIMYNCNIVKNTTTFGIDYTLSSAHEVVPIVSAISNFNTTPYQTWRTAFRECAKIRQFCDEKNNPDDAARLAIWTASAVGQHAEWCLQGARDGVLFYQTNKDNPVELKKAFDWKWLNAYFASLYSNVATPDLTLLEHRQSLWPPQ